MIIFLYKKTHKKTGLNYLGKTCHDQWWNNGKSSKMARECPGPEWKLGRIIRPNLHQILNFQIDQL